MVRRVVVTGLGIVSPLGCDLGTFWDRLVAGRSGIRRLPAELVPDVEAKVGGSVPARSEDPAGFDEAAVVVAKDRKKMDRFILFALEAARQALNQAGWKPASDDESGRTATVIGSGIGGFPAIADAVRTVDNRGARRLSPFVVPSFLANLAAGQVSIRHNLTGPIGAPVTACAAGVQAIGDAMRLIRAGEADVAVCGGAEACIDRVSLGGFAAARGLSTAYNDEPARASRPFDQDRDGFVMGEGAGILVIEALEHAEARGAEPLAEILGYGTSADAFHMAASPPDGAGAQRAMRRALAMSGLPPDAIGYVNAHATSTQVGDASELAALRAIFGMRAGAGGPAISSTKSATGHLLGAAGGLEAVISILALRSGVLPPTLNLERPDAGSAGLDLIGTEARRSAIEHVLSNGFGFGGVNASLIFGAATR